MIDRAWKAALVPWVMVLGPLGGGWAIATYFTLMHGLLILAVILIAALSVASVMVYRVVKKESR